MQTFDFLLTWFFGLVMLAAAIPLSRIGIGTLSFVGVLFLLSVGRFFSLAFPPRKNENMTNMNI